MKVTISQNKRHSYSFEVDETKPVTIYIAGEVALIIDPDDDSKAEIASGGVM